MIKNFPFFLFIFVTINLYSQKFEGFSGYVVTNKKDTIQCKFESVSNLFWKNIFKPSQLRNFVKTINTSGEKRKYKPFEIISFTVLGTEKGNYKFVSTQADNYKHFYHEIIFGKISFFKIYDQDMNANIISENIFIKNDEVQEIWSLSFRDDFGKLLIDFPELYRKWIDSDNYYKKNQFDEVIRLYNAHFHDQK